MITADPIDFLSIALGILIISQLCATVFFLLPGSIFPKFRFWRVWIFFLFSFMLTSAIGFYFVYKTPFQNKFYLRQIYPESEIAKIPNCNLLNASSDFTLYRFNRSDPFLGALLDQAVNFLTLIESYPYWRYFWRTVLSNVAPHTSTNNTLEYKIENPPKGISRASFSMRFAEVVKEQSDMTPSGSFSLSCRASDTRLVPIRPYGNRIVNINFKEHMTFELPKECFSGGPILIRVEFERWRDVLSVISEFYGVSEKFINQSFKVQGLEAYTDKLSYEAGQNIEFHISSEYKNVKLEILQLSNLKKAVFSQNIESINQREFTYASSINGADWPVSLVIPTPISWRPGYYVARLSNKKDVQHTYFVIGNDKAHDNANVVVIAPTNTWQAYNSWGGESLYTSSVGSCLGLRQGRQVSFERPLKIGPPNEESHLVHSDVELTKWLDKNEIKFNLISDHDLHTKPKIIKKYGTVILSAHPEYWTNEMKSALEEFIANGGNLAYLGGNGLYQRVSILNGIMEGYNHLQFHEQDGNLGGAFRYLGFHESRLLGVEYNSIGFKEYSKYYVSNSKHWAFNGTKLNNGDSFGSAKVNNKVIEASGHETDKVTINSPASTVILASGFGEGGANMTIYSAPSGGTVFSVGSIAFLSTINSDKVQGKILLNVINKFKN